MSIHLEKKITRRSWDLIPILYTIIAQVNDLEKWET